MTSATITAQTAAARPRRNVLRLVLTETKFEFLKLLRLPVYSVATLAFPLMFYLLFGSFYGNLEAQGVLASRYMVATFGAAGVLSAALFSFGVGVASERGQGWMRLKRVSPMPPMAYFVAKIVMAFIFSTLSVLAVTFAGLVLGHARFDLLEWLTMYGAFMLGVGAFSGLGLAVGYLFGPNSAPVVINLIYMPMAFLSGLWMPIEFLPPFIQRIAEFLPTYHYAQLVLSTLGAKAMAPVSTHLLVLAGFTVLFLGLAAVAYFRDEGKTYG